MSNTAKVIARLIEAYVASANKNGAEYRIVIPGLTAGLGAEVHDTLRASSINSYLAISNGRQPDEARRWLDPISLTNIRIGSFVAITDPGAMAEVRDSIRGTGGAIRSVGFSEEWPWIDDGSEAFRFRSSFAPALVATWTASADERIWFQSFLADGLIPATRRLPDRAPLLLDDIVGAFDPAALVNVGTPCERFLLHCGVPKPATIAADARRLIADTRLLVRNILERARKEGDLRRVVLGRVQGDPDAIGLTSALNAFFDGLAAHTSLEGDLLAFRRCWGAASERARNWGLLTAERLRQLFEIQDVESITLACGWLDGANALVSEDRITIAAVSGGSLQLLANYDIPPAEFQAQSCRLVVAVRNTQLAEVALPSCTGAETVAIDLSEISHRTRIPISVTVLVGQTIRGQFRLYAHCCGEQRPAFVVGTPGYWVVNAEDISDDPSPAQRQQVDGPVTLHMFSVTDEQPRVLVDEDHECQVAKAPNRVWTTATPINALDATGGQVDCTCHLGQRWLRVTLAAENTVRGEFTLEDELRRALVAGQAEATKTILAIFDGESSEPYHRLGGINKQTLRRSRLARCFEDRSGWQPILADLFDSEEGTVQACGQFARAIASGASTHAIEKVVLPDRGLSLITTYAERRDAFRSAVLSCLRNTSSSEEHPNYATHPFYLTDNAKGRKNIEAALLGFLQAYLAILEYLRSPSEVLSWEQRFVPTYLDCVVNWREGNSQGAVFLVGPWHPLVVAKRFMVQRALALRARKLVDGTSRSALRHLAGLLGDVAGFNWQAALKANDSALEPAYVVATSDPGWHFGFKREAADIACDDSTERIVLRATTAIRANLGIEARVRLPSTTAMVRAILNGYIRTFPSRRHLSIHFSNGFAGEEELRESDDFLHDEGKPTLAGAQLPGGINVSFGEKPAVPEDIQWSEPPLKVFLDGGKIDGCDPNIDFAGSRDDVRFLDIGDAPATPRGNGFGAVFSQPLSRVVPGQTGIAQSVTLEWDRPSQEAAATGVGDLFAQACALNCALCGLPRGIVKLANLPHSLQATWTVIPGTVLDPAVFVRYVRDGQAKAIEERALWDYRISVARTSTSYFVLSTIPAAFKNALGGIFPSAPNLAAECISELGQLGLAIGGEAMKSGRHALGTLGVVAAVRLFHPGGGQPGAFEWTQNRTGFLIPVDSFLDLLERRTPGESENSNEADLRRGDLIAMCLSVPEGNAGKLRIEALVIECKYTGGALDTQYASDALAQSQRSLARLTDLCQAALNEDGMPERLALMQLVRFGLRISGGHLSDHTDRQKQECAVYSCLLRGEFEFFPTKATSLLVSTELSLPGSAEVAKQGNGVWVRLNRQHWPGVVETASVTAARKAIRELFSSGMGPQEQRPAAPENPPPPNRPSGSANVQPVVMPRPMENLPPTPPPSAPSAPDDGNGVLLPQILVGMDSSRRAVYFDPHSAVDRLDNANTMVTGSSGKGKTQLIKYLVTAVRESGANAIMLDFKNDFVGDSHFTSAARLDPTLVAFDGMPFNPLIPFPIADPRTGKKFIQCAQHITGIAAVFRRTYSLGAQQEAAVKNAIRTAFTNAGVDPAGIVPFNPETTFPDLAAVGEILEETNPSAYNRLDPLFTLGLFREQFWRTSFASMVNRSVALDFSQLPSDELKNALAELVVLSAHAYFNSQPHCGRLKQMFVVDEAHRILKADFLERFALECRAYGVGLLLASQYPSQFPPDISACMATKVIHGNDRDVDRVRDIVNLLGCPGRESSIADLSMFEAIFSNKHFRNVAIRTLTYPAYIVLSKIKEVGALSLSEIEGIPGFDPQKLSAGNIVFHLERLGLCETFDGKVRLVRREA